MSADGKHPSNGKNFTPPIYPSIKKTGLALPFGILMDYVPPKDRNEIDSERGAKIKKPVLSVSAPQVMDQYNGKIKAFFFANSGFRDANSW
jgi:hypothetical protein